MSGRNQVGREPNFEYISCCTGFESSFHKFGAFMNGQENDLRGATAFRKTLCDLDTANSPMEMSITIRSGLRFGASRRPDSASGSSAVTMNSSLRILRTASRIAWTVVCQQNSNALQTSLQLTATLREWPSHTATELGMADAYLVRSETPTGESYCVTEAL
jgi:hypothetical protein